MAKTRRCKSCNQKNEKFIVINLKAFCDFECASKFGREKAVTDKQEATKTANREQKKQFRLNDTKLRKKAAKDACHAYIRARDKYQPCICCGRDLGDTYHAGHWLESGNNPQIRFDEDNIHGQRVDCNFFKGGDSGDYEKNLRVKIGGEKVDALLSKKGGTSKLTASDYLDIEVKYKAKLKGVSYQ
jgi:hypothetical protein